MWYIYLLLSDRRTYVGATTDPARRLRQHNGEIRGGARSTRGRQWQLVCTVGAFEDKSSALRWERIVKCRARGLLPRYTTMQGLVNRICPPGRREYPVPAGLQCTVHTQVTVTHTGGRKKK